MPDVIAAASELPAASGGNFALAGASAAAAGGGFLAFLDGYLCGSENTSGESGGQPVTSGKPAKKPCGDPLPVTVATPATVPPPPPSPPWTLDATELPAPDDNTPPLAAATRAAGPAAAPADTTETAKLPPWAQSLPESPGESKAETSGGPLAFAARLVPSTPPAATPQASAELSQLPQVPQNPLAMPQNLLAMPQNPQTKGSSAPSPSLQATEQHAHDASRIPASQESAGSSAGGQAGADNPPPGRDGNTSVPAAAAPVSASQKTAGREDAESTPRAGVQSVWNIDVPAPADRTAAPVKTDPAPAAAPVRAVDLEPAAPPVAAVSHDVSLHLADGQSSVDIRLAERAGEIHVTVHTPDQNLAGSLRADLPDLVGKLRQSGYQAEAWRPAAPESGRRSGSDTPSSQQDATFTGRDRRQHQPQQQQTKNQNRWAGAWKSSLEPAPESQT